MRTWVAVLMTVLVCSGVGLVLFLAQPAPSATAARECSQSTLLGGYGFTSSNPNPGGIPIAALGRIEFDGRGAFQTNYTAAVDGQYVMEKLTGTYSVLKDCSGTAIAVSSSGKMRFWLITDTAGRELRILGGPPASYGLLIASRQHTN